MNRLVYYSLAFPPDGPRPDLIQQLDLSAETLRRFNSKIPIVLFLYGEMTQEILTVCARHGVMVQSQGAYEERLAQLCPIGWPALNRYPVLHRFLNFAELAGSGADQLLYLDCDTLFFDDIELLFDRYRDADMAAREEVHTSRSAHGIDRTFVDEPLLHEIAVYSGARAIPPFNIGVILFNHGIWHRLGQLQGIFVDYVWRFVTWMAMNPVNGSSAAYGEFRGVAEALALAGPVDLARALPYPSSNRWIVDEVALWLTLGHLDGVCTADFHPNDVAQNGETLQTDPSFAPWIVCHYFTQNSSRVQRWFRSHMSTQNEKRFATLR